MPRTVWTRTLLLSACPLIEAYESGRAAEAIAALLPDLEVRDVIPVALRWISDPFYGFCRRPFEVYRRTRRAGDLRDHGTPFISLPLRVSGRARIAWDGTPMHDVAFRVIPAPGASVTVVARDDRGERLPGQIVTL